MIAPNIDVHRKPDTETPGARNLQSRSESCARIKNLGFAASRHIKMYGERFEIVSDPYYEGDCIAVHAISESDPKTRTLMLPITILVGMTERFLKKANVTVQ